MFALFEILKVKEIHAHRYFFSIFFGVENAVKVAVLISVSIESVYGFVVNVGEANAIYSLSPVRIIST